jgi:hypothetical protein
VPVSGVADIPAVFVRGRLDVASPLGVVWRLAQQLVPCQNSDTASGLVFLRSLRCPRVLPDQAVDDLSALDLGGHVDRLVGLVQRRPLLP